MIKQRNCLTRAFTVISIVMVVGVLLSSCNMFRRLKLLNASLDVNKFGHTDSIVFRNVMSDSVSVVETYCIKDEKMINQIIETIQRHTYAVERPIKHMVVAGVSFYVGDSVVRIGFNNSILCVGGHKEEYGTDIDFVELLNKMVDKRSK